MANDDAAGCVSVLTVVAAALVNTAGEVLVQQRPAAKAHGGLWEFPGGKVEPGETPEHALARELAEELGIAVDPAILVPLAFATEPHGERHLLLLLYLARHWLGDPVATEADAIAWLRPAALHALPMPPADLPLVQMLERLI
jgi:8-oxo-dGTP diphosphatase